VCGVEGAEHKGWRGSSHAVVRCVTELAHLAILIVAGTIKIEMVTKASLPTLTEDIVVGDSASHEESLLLVLHDCFHLGFLISTRNNVRIGEAVLRVQMLRRIVKASPNRKIGVRRERSPSAFAVNALKVESCYLSRRVKPEQSGGLRAHSIFAEVEPGERAQPRSEFTFSPGEANARKPGEFGCYRHEIDIPQEIRKHSVVYAGEATASVIWRDRQCPR
jgi:hypothetical protein